jgi:hypothetical protein
LNESLETSSGLVLLTLREDIRGGFSESGGVSGVPAGLESLSKMLESLEDKLPFEAGERASNDWRIGVFFLNGNSWDDDPVAEISYSLLSVSPWSDLGCQFISTTP